MTPKLQRVVRLDSLPLERAQFTEEGFLVDRPILTSVGIFEYRNPNGSIRRELRLPEEVFAEESLKSFRGKPIVITHDAGLIDKNNVHDETIGTIISDGYKSGNDVRAEIIIHDTDEMKESGLKELSLGYNLELDETPGVWSGEHYDAIQRNIRVNHLALVREARAGDRARLNIDGRDSENNTLQGGRVEMSKKLTKVRRNDGILSPEDLAKAIEEYKKRRAAGNEDAEDEEVVAAEEEVVTDAEEEEVAEPEKVEDKIQFVKDRRDRRDEDGDPKSQKEAMGIIAHQDEDIDMLFDIIDTLLAEKDFEKDAAEEEVTEEVTEEPEAVEEEEKVVEDAEDEEVAEEEMTEDADDEEVVEEEEEVMDAEDDEFMDEEEEEITEDAEDEVIDEEEEEEFATDCGPRRMNHDSVDRLVRQRVKLALIGRELHMDGLENMKLRTAKKKVIKAVKPGLRLDGKSDAYINAAFDMACDSVKSRAKKTTKYQKQQMFSRKSRMDGTVSKDSSDAARNRMIKRYMNKEDK